MAGLARSTSYDEPGLDRPENLALMRLLDELYLQRPFYGVPRMTDWLQTLGHAVNHKRVARLMRVMGGQVVLPGPHTSRPRRRIGRTPICLRDLVVDRPHPRVVRRYHVCADAAGLLVSGGRAGLVPSIRGAWALSNRLEARFCLEAVDQALETGRPEIFNTEQGAQFIGEAFTGRLAEAHIRISMEGRGRALDNVFVERLWRSVKYEELYRRDYADGAEAWSGVRRHGSFYNTARRHQSLGRRTSADVYFG